MNHWVLLAVAVGLALDAFAVALGTSIAICRVSGRQVFRLSFHFGLFQALMPILGWAGGRLLAEVVAPWDHWVAFALLSAIGLKSIWESVKKDDDGRAPRDPTLGWSLMALSVATSIDALAVGLSLAMLGVAILFPAVVIGLTAGLLTVIGMLAGGRLGVRFGSRLEAFGGLVLIGIGIKIVVDHTLG